VRILIVDDSRVMRMLLRRTLREAELGEHEVIEATDGAEALALVAAQPPDVILADWKMPGLSGIDLISSLRARGLTVPVGLVTSEGTEATRELARRAGASFLLAKPFTAAELAAALAEHLR
jgi:two-component system chemotaxis response regulator CheY